MQQDADHVRTDAVVAGGGPAGLTAAIALASSGIATVLIAPPHSRTDNRTTALMAGSVNALRALDAWDMAQGNAAPLRVMRIVDDTGRLWRAPEVAFDCGEIGLEAFGHNIENAKLVAALERRARDVPSLTVIEDTVAALDCGPDQVAIVTGGGRRYSAALVVGADGRKSVCREAAGIGVDTRDYPQAALTVTFTHTRPHRDTSTEFHTRSGPFTLVPLPGNRSSLVWVLDPREANDIAALDDAQLSAEIERRAHSILGKVTLDPGRSMFPLSVSTARRFGAKRISLVGEAAHVVPPIGAQGLNLGLRDAATIGELAADAHRTGDDIGGEDVLARYHERRSADVGSRTLAIDLLNRSLLSDLLPAQGARGLGLYLMDRIGPLRRAMMREGVMPSASQPRLMRGEAI
ncbi:MAG: UbiH/UbiF family hydroxylase [Xanthobacteraceae bacterium]|uniref:UbiH/UbiF family hydroxylase n=1 Tax=Pseudolabrys sp. TaxID=1960880 RepID=UPI003D0EE8C2